MKEEIIVWLGFCDGKAYVEKDTKVIEGFLYRSMAKAIYEDVRKFKLVPIK